jgi:hypothetical protein
MISQTTGHKELQASTTCGQAVPGFDVFNPESLRTLTAQSQGPTSGVSRGTSSKAVSKNSCPETTSCLFFTDRGPENGLLRSNPHAW